MNKRVGVFLVLVFVLILFGIAGFSIAQSGLEGIGDQATETAENVSESIDVIKTKFLGEKWKEYLLENRFISNVNSFFENINFLFVILFSRSWSLSLEMLFVFVMWLFVLLSIENYLIWFNAIFMLRDEWQRVLGSFAATLLLAHIQLFNTLANVATKIIFYKSSTLWSVLAFVVVFAAIIVILLVNKHWAAKLKKAKEDQEKAELKTDVEANKEFIEQVSEASEK